MRHWATLPCTHIKRMLAEDGEHVTILFCFEDRYAVNAPLRWLIHRNHLPEPGYQHRFAGPELARSSTEPDRNSPLFPVVIGITCRLRGGIVQDETTALWARNGKLLEKRDGTLYCQISMEKWVIEPGLTPSLSNNDKQPGFEKRHGCGEASWINHVPPLPEEVVTRRRSRCRFLRSIGSNRPADQRSGCQPDLHQ